MTHPYQGFYINLDRSTERRAALEAQFAKFGIQDRYSRFAAVDGSALNLGTSKLTPGETGAFLSHTRVLEDAHNRRIAAHVLEDDALLSEPMAKIIGQAIAAGVTNRFDILFLDTLVAPHLGMLKLLLSLCEKTERTSGPELNFSDLNVVDLRGAGFSCMTSYVVGANALERVQTVLKQELAAGPRRQIDLALRDAVLTGKLRAACLVPFVTSIRLEEIATTMVAGSGTLAKENSVMALAVLRYILFAGRDFGYAKAQLDAAIGERSPSPTRDAALRILDFILSDDFVEF